MPEGPAVAGRRPLHLGADLMDRAAHARPTITLPSARTRAATRRLGVDQHLAGAQQAALDQAAERHPRRLALRRADDATSFGGAGRTAAMRAARQRDIGRLALDADEAAAEPLRHRAGRAGAEERVEHDVARLGRGQQHPVQQRLGLLRRMRLLAVAVAAAAPAPPAERDQPVAAHLQFVVERLHRLVVEGVARLARLGAPDQRLVRVGEAACRGNSASGSICARPRR